SHRARHSRRSAAPQGGAAGRGPALRRAHRNGAVSRREILLNPGPVTLSERVRNALGRPDQCHREQEFADLVLSIRARLERVYEDTPADHDAVILSGSGTCAVEAMVASLVPRDGTALVPTNGVYGERIAAMLAAQ